MLTSSEAKCRLHTPWGKALIIGDLDGIRIFIHVAELRSFSAAAKRLRMSSSLVSKHVSRLEEALGVSLLHRSTHNLHLTDCGAEYFHRCKRSFLAIEDAELAVQSLDAGAAGKLRIHVTPGLGQRLIEPAVVRFMKVCPNLDVELSISPELINPLEQGVDIAIRSGDTDELLLRHSSLGYREFGTLHYVVCASKEYLSIFGTPKHPTDLVRHNCLIQSTQASAQKWWFRGADGDYSVAVRGNLVSNSHTAITEAMRQGLGIARIMSFGGSVPQGGEKCLFSEAAVPRRIMRAFYPRGQSLPVKTSRFFDFLNELLKGENKDQSQAIRLVK
jgi:DNA-binding transcriptional LysR family regulator